MPSKAQPKVFCLSVRTHKLSVMITTPQEEAISKLKEEVLSALTALYLHGDRVSQVPTAKTVDDFELCRAMKEKGKATGDYELLDVSGRVKDNLVSWDSVYIRFRDESGELQPVEVEVPVLVEDDEEELVPVASSSKGKRKAPE
ncbi:hypothetical protein BJ322DRAFT_1075139 [Thelephora terrestris]|uniref:Uncharacterized protein n=1 Tax=Thelephora terrestris TaxID=56493 RepID=A0A9P6H983_9AGAM|nr:hypothetical protein BJ322DRAFT_1075139 [Thelephora terrestris]